MPQEIRLEHTKEGDVVSACGRWIGVARPVSLAPLPDQGKLNNPCKLINQARSASYPATAVLSNKSLTQNDEEADENGGKSTHTQSQDLFLLHQLAIGAREAAWAKAGVPVSVVPIDTSAPVSARVIQALVPILATLPVSGYSLTSRAPVSRGGQVSGVSWVTSQGGNGQ